MQIERKELIQELLHFFGKLPEVNSVKLRGSIVSGKTDRFSDIDLLVEGAISDIETFATLTLQRINSHFEIEFFDWATSLMPNEYIVTFYFKNTSIFWNIDVQFISDSIHKSSSKFINNPIYHLIKLWILNLKYLQRQQYDKLTVEKLARKLEITDDIAPYHKIMREIFENIQNQSDMKLDFFLLECEKELEIYEKQFVQTGFLNNHTK